MADDDKASRSRAIIAWGTLGTAVVTALAAVGLLQFRKGGDDVAAYQQQVHAVCNQIHDLASPTNANVGVHFEGDVLHYDKALISQSLQNSYQAIKVQFNLLDLRNTPSALQSQKMHEEVVRDSYLAFGSKVIQVVKRDLPDDPTQAQLDAVQGPLQAEGKTTGVQMDDALTSLAGGECKVTP